MQFLFEDKAISDLEFSKKFPVEWELLQKFGQDITIVVHGEQIALKNEVGTPLKIDIQEKLDYHRRFFHKNSKYSQPLARAIGLKKGKDKPRVADVTAGMLGDTLLMKAMGVEVLSIERHPLVAALAYNALKFIGEQSNFIHGNCLDYLMDIQACDCTYFDPMFQLPSEKTAPKKAMQIFRNLVGKDQDALEVANILRKNSKRLVIKRPIKSSPLLDNPSLTQAGKSTGYDIYLNNQ